MKTGICYILLIFTAILLLSATAQAAEYREVGKEVNASDILAHIEKGDDINLESCRVVGELNVSEIKLETITISYDVHLMPDIPYSGAIKHTIRYETVYFVKSNITIKNLYFENKVDLSRVFFNGTTDFSGSIFNTTADFSGSIFNATADFNGLTFKNAADFQYLYFNNNADFQRSNFNNAANFNESIFNNADFQQSNFYGPANFGVSTFNNAADFSKSTFYNATDFSGSIFNDIADFQQSNFYGPANFGVSTFNRAGFYRSTFNNAAYFRESIFNDIADFSESTFNDKVDFYDSTFKLTIFSKSTFNGYTNFGFTFFNGTTSFSRSTFNNAADFRESIFNDISSFIGKEGFCGSTFNNTVDFSESTFNNAAYFSESTFNNAADFSESDFEDIDYLKVPEKSENIFTDGKTCELFRRSYNNFARYKDADNIYYNSRKKSMDKESSSLSKITDFLSWITCGFGTKLEFTVLWIIGIICFFALVYRIRYTTSVIVGVKNKIEPDRVYYTEYGIYRSSEEDKTEKSEVSFLECLCFSINTFTRLGTPNWHPSTKLWYAVTIEGILGWVMLAIFLATLMHSLIRP